MGRLRWIHEKPSIEESRLTPDFKDKQIEFLNEGFGSSNIIDTSITRPGEVIYGTERFCPHCGGSETSTKNKKNIKKELEKKYIQYVLEFIGKQYFPLGVFTTKSLRDDLGISHISDGTMQRNALSILSILGLVNRERQEFKNKKGDLKYREIFSIGDGKYRKCYNSKSDCHVLDWETESIEKNYFWKNVQNRQKTKQSTQGEKKT